MSTDDPRHPHLSTGYEHTETVAEPTAAPAADAPKSDEDDKPKRPAARKSSSK